MGKMMSDQLKMAFQWVLEYNGESYHMLLMLLALLYIFFKKERDFNRRLFVGHCAIFTAVYFCPVFSWAITRFIGELVYFRVLWILPLPIVLAYVMGKIWLEAKKKWKRGVLLAGFAVMLTITGKFIYLEDNPFEPRSNWEKVPSSPAAICEIVNANRFEDDWVLLAAPEDMVPYIRIYDASINQVYGRKGRIWPGGKAIVKILDDEIIDYDKLCTTMRKISCNFLVLPEGEGRIENLTERQFQVIGQVGSYLVYKDLLYMPK